MNHQLSRLAALLFLVLVASCGTAPYSSTTVSSTHADAVSVQAPECQFKNVAFSADFEAGRLNACEDLGGDRYRLRFDPENTPVNHSPWYAFQVTSRQSQEITVELTYTKHSHRYWPKLSGDGVQWHRAPRGAVTTSEEGDATELRLRVDALPLWVAAQEIVTNEQHDRWIEALTKTTVFESDLLGISKQGRTIKRLESNPAESNRYVVLVGRQHPPEITGALAMQAFLERLTEFDEIAASFRDRYGVIAVPNLNPDGVAAGNWRHNTGGIDLNRDWGPFTQPETQLMRDELNRFHGDDELVLFLDFHSTFYDVLYTQPRSAPTKPEGLTWRWIDRIQAAITKTDPGYPVHVRPGHNADSPTSKTYVYETFGVPAITFELDDETDRDFIHRYARVAAEQMMIELLELED